MSIRAMTAVWDHAPVVGSELLLLLALADAANDDLECWPGIRYLAHKVRVSERHVQRMLSSLEQQGLIQRVLHGGRGRYEGWESNRYRLILEMGNTGAVPMSSDARGGGASTTASNNVVVMSSPDAQVTTSPDARVTTSPDAQVTQNHHRESSWEAEESACAGARVRGDARAREALPTPTSQNRLDSLPNSGRVVKGQEPHPSSRRTVALKADPRKGILEAYWAGIDGFGTPPRYLLRDAAELVEMGAAAEDVRQMAAEKQAGRIEQYELRWLVEDFARWKGEQRRKAKERAEIEAIKAVVERERAWTRILLGQSA